ncbi:peroxide stress protein YaaA [Helicobacter mustelae]|uniref:Uncharacterized protein n=1 Tax=Helicobacter mustelae (strain ATCC 43772 / CCUG 25715 / CIP 103759 / LMG 18044 / NCTC 12198 / R85-136P) TaxID=679897 RepID=D3UGM2_HELM1|nr:peroxide stress protein YaaA [Helicobacter mustelae]CBG39643.1 Putative hypothetical protein [Helicobacter mustelae 12198]SQH71154.1 Protein of uncharacterised function (DUF328) [Helicobacter mustelae]STP12282.1 Protein of uncharacterised function (DUF328) [Helicobacter mustelae]
MKVLFSPSEGKNISPSAQKPLQKMQKNLWEELEPQMPQRKAVIEAYLEALRENGDEVYKIFGVRKISPHELELCKNLLHTPRTAAILLYDGVAYKALDFASLGDGAQKFVRENVYIFSNLFGAVLADSPLPFYKLNQNYRGRGFGLQEIYKKTKTQMDEVLIGECVIDLRAEVYTKAYALDFFHIRVEFLKNGKKLSHIAKHYRGIFLRHLAHAWAQGDRIEQQEVQCIIKDMQMEGVELSDIRTTPLAHTYVYQVQS